MNRMAPRCNSGRAYVEAKVSGCGAALMACTLMAIEEKMAGLAPIELSTLLAALAARLEAPKVSAWAQLAGSLHTELSQAGGEHQSPVWATACGTVHWNVSTALAAAGLCASGGSASTVAAHSPLDHRVRPARELRHNGDSGDASGDGTPPSSTTTATTLPPPDPTIVVYVDPHHPHFSAALLELYALPAHSAARIFLRYRPYGCCRSVGGGQG